MKKIFVALCMVAFLVACGDDDSWSPSDADNSRSSSVIPGSDPESSSAEKQGSSSSSSVILSSSEGSSDSRSSDSKGNSSSVNKEESSSSLDGFDWSLPKEAFLNPEIDYDTLIDSRDGKVYRTVKIGDQVWMAENLNYDDSVATPSLIGRSWCYEDDSKNCDVAGRLYTWAAAIDSVKLATDADNPQDCGSGKYCSLPDTVYGICPPGWHLPSFDEWDTLFATVRVWSSASTILKSQTGWYGKGNGSDYLGFSALPVGKRYGNGGFLGAGFSAYFWSSTAYFDFDSARCMYIENTKLYAWLEYVDKAFGFSVRCVKD